MTRPLAGVFLLAGSLAFATPPRIPGTLLQKPPTIDGTIDEIGEWKEAASFGGLVDDQTATLAPENATYWLAYDKQFIYFAVRASDSEPGAIRATEYRTNVGLGADDHVTLEIDPVGALNDADQNTFQFNPNGATNVRLAGGRAGKREWAGEILAKGRITKQGYEIEARIPWSTMALPSGGGKRTVRFNISRFVPRLNRSFSYTFTNNGRVQETPQWEGVVLPRPAVDRSLRLLPYFYGGYDADRKGHIANAGVDFKTSLTDQISLVGSANPDFRNIENQILSLDFSRFERLAGETRPFFQEGGSYYGSSLVATQRFPNFDSGVNVYGKLSDKLSFGILDTIDFGTRNNLAFAFQNQIDSMSSVRVAGTSLTSNELHNTAYLVRYERTSGAFYGQIRREGSFDRTDGEGSRTRANMFYARGFWGHYLNLYATQPDFNPRLGFVQERDLVGPTGGTFYNRNFRKGPLQEVNAGFDGTYYDRLSGGYYRRNFSGYGGVTFRNLLRFSVSRNEGDFLGSKDKTTSFSVSYPNGNAYRSFFASTDQGIQVDQPYQANTIGMAWRADWRFQLNGSYQTFKLGNDFSDQLILTGNYDLGGDRAVVGRLVKRGADWSGYVALRRSGNRGAEWFLIFGDPNSARFVPSLTLKVTVPIRLG